METNELRLGNYIMDKKDENLECVYLLHDIGDHKYINDLHPDSCIPIPLTEKWLLKFGFEYSDQEGYLIKYLTSKTDNADELKKFLRIDVTQPEYIENGEIVDLLNGKEDSVFLQERFLYVHQLQNLFFALKGKELSLK